MTLRVVLVVGVALAGCAASDGGPHPMGLFFQGAGATGSLSGGLGAMMTGQPAAPVQRVVQPPAPIIQPMQLQPMQPMQPPNMSMGFTCSRVGNMVTCL